MPSRLHMIETPLKTAIRESGLKQTWLAEQCGVRKEHLNRVIHGLHPSEDLADDLVRHLQRRGLPVTHHELWPHLYATATGDTRKAA